MGTKKHRKKSSKNRKRRRSWSKKKDRRSKGDRKTKHRLDKKHGKRSRSRSKKRRSSKHHRRDKGSKKRDRDEQHRSPHKKHKKHSKPHPDMTAAAMNENLGNIVLVKDRHKTPRGDSKAVATAMEPSTGPGTPAPTTTGTKPTGSEPKTPSGTTKDTGTTTVPTGTTGTTGGPATEAKKKDTPYNAAPPEVNIPPLGAEFEPSPAPMATATTTTTPTATTTGTGTTTAAATTGQTTTTTAVTTDTVYGTGYTVTPSYTGAAPSDELTRKESAEEKSGCDRGQKWKTYMEKTLEQGVEGMANEFRTIRGFLPPMATRLAFDANPEKNRFEDIVCIDQTRVRLSDGHYIHASWVNITASKKAILTQLPVHESGAQFWQMVLDTDAQAILLLLTHAEFNMFHANGVFPAEQDFLHFEGSHVRVGEFKRVVIDRDWTMHVISVRSGDRRKYVHMHHYSGWTHGKQPCRLTDIWQLQSVFRKYQNPHIYMSLSGCGRAGTFAAFQIAHERLHSDNFSKLNISDCICRARLGRMHAVQRIIQMQTIHAAIMEHIMGTKFAAQLQPKTLQKYEDFIDRFNKCAEVGEDLQ